MTEFKIQINSLGEMNLYLHARAHELRALMNEDTNMLTWARLREIETLINMINLGEPQ